ncbi:hypothetical protein N7452_002409 [Penicillium brevicompactum]|uniref:Nucleoside phosphorylase domain-containing protein n=1 Tax=Penicillium brevicompactum TaxID=5074 RepID=A0A9W9QRJ7_PENBR|nr:hypothetical protein N7452_002409 [Penicillium brevicompactum]
MGEHNVIIAVLSNGEYKTAFAASVTTNILNSFHNIRISLIVKIGEGILSESYNIQLGDVVVSAPRDDKSDMFQYDFVLKPVTSYFARYNGGYLNSI